MMSPRGADLGANFVHPALRDVAIERAILQTVAYGDIFDYPLTAQEIHQFLIEIATSLDTVQVALDGGTLVPDRLSRHQGFFVLPGRECIIDTRRRRAEVAAKMWPRARSYGLAIARLPFVRMVAVTGALAVDNVEPGDDFDYLIVTKPGRLWLCRAIIIAFVVKPAARQGNVVCPNYLLSERALVVDDRNLFTAHELAQMVPIAGYETYRRLRQLNTWSTQFLPNTGNPRPRAETASAAKKHIYRLAENVLRMRPGRRLERWEMSRKVRKLSQQANSGTEFAFSPDWCKGHFDDHEHYILMAFEKRLETIKD